jgi:hypothetical protein
MTGLWKNTKNLSPDPQAEMWNQDIPNKQCAVVTTRTGHSTARKADAGATSLMPGKGMGKVVSVHHMKVCGGMEVQLYSFLTSALDASERSTSRTGRFTPRKGPRYELNMMGAPQSRSGRFWKRSYLLSLQGFEPPRSKSAELLLSQADGRTKV